MDINYIKNIKSNYLEVLSKYKNKQNKLLSSLIYSYELLDSFDNKLLLIPYIINKQNVNINNIVSLSLIFSILSLNILYDFPHMLDNSHRNKKLSLHMIYGETISQLASFCLYIEASNVILYSSLKDNEIIDLLNNEHLTIKNSNLINNLSLIDNTNTTNNTSTNTTNNISKELIYNDYIDKITNIIYNVIIIIITKSNIITITKSIRETLYNI